MIVKSLHVCSFRSIVDETLECTQLTALLGPNSCGKSSFLRALDLFYSPHPRFTADDFYVGESSRSIELEKTLSQEIGKTEYARLLEECQNNFDISEREQAKKNPMVISALLQEAKDNGHGLKTLEQIFRKIMALRSGKETSKGTYQPMIADVQTYDDAAEEYAVHAEPVAVRADDSF